MANTRKSYLILLLTNLLVAQADRPCWHAHLQENRSSVCVCSPDYCDDVTREPPSFGNFVIYSSSEAGQRFEKRVESLETFYFNPEDQSCVAKGHCWPAMFVDTRTLYQTVEGFGGATTDSATINWANLEDERLKQHMIDAYFSKRGLEYNMIRVPIAGTDFSTHAYAYNMEPPNDADLSNFSLAYEDYQYKIPFIRRAKKAAAEDIHLLATTWSPPAWMKTDHNLTGISRLLPKYYQTYADYHLKFIEAYNKEGISIWGITTTNEPTNAVENALQVTFNSLGWVKDRMGEWIADNLGPTIRNSKFKDVKILCNDDQRNHLFSYFNLMVIGNPEALKFIDGVAVHYYLDKLVPPEVITASMKDHPDKFIMSTEACAGFKGDEIAVDLGSWERAQTYISDIIEDLNYNLTGWIDWNLCLDEQGGPNWVQNYVDSPIIIANDKRRFYKQPMFYAMGHASKFIPRGSRRVHVRPLCENSVQNVAFLTPENTVVTLLHNPGEATVVHLVTCNRLAKVPMEKNSIVTVEFLHEQCRSE